MAGDENYDIHDASIATLQFDSGAVGQITSGCIADKHGGSRVSITVKGKNWSVNTSSDRAVLNSEEDQREVDSGQSWQEQLGNGDRAFLQAVKSGDASGVLSPYISGAQTLAITLAANQSMSTGQPVKVRRFV